MFSFNSLILHHKKSDHEIAMIQKSPKEQVLLLIMAFPIAIGNLTFKIKLISDEKNSIKCDAP